MEPSTEPEVPEGKYNPSTVQNNLKAIQDLIKKSTIPDVEATEQTGRKSCSSGGNSVKFQRITNKNLIDNF
ncbi:unnamed protein product [Menidia menidia]|uniref:(Atlantic silverside) hypothetical protein n=1 Tax=Menidia menidia TaxID=238744 RepID=A0A8S4B2J4_9TELE|nr:unnamed protein product [Menidia menidia]